MGDLVYANTNLTLVDDGHIYIGDKVMFGPNVVVATANHPIDAELRDRGLQYNKDVHIGDNTWIGASVVIVPGVNIGKNFGSITKQGRIICLDFFSRSNSSNVFFFAWLKSIPKRGRV